MANTTTSPDPDPQRAIIHNMELADQQAEKLRQRAEELKKFAQRYMDSSYEQSHISVEHQSHDPVRRDPVRSDPTD
ncbi:hypothetical protein [Tunicatimonas pelagia]|uniref:hypothetical protein n=1 Tax=Tunicatimonas pelagia TaxID=931531 RepID=UPI0026650568|nr:hypothetical protein [Tunicatimonas pelagia]WKN43932.1 hypothetical protein P0M28_02970 [Tunicatimonas pelagia]